MKPVIRIRSLPMSKGKSSFKGFSFRKVKEANRMSSKTQQTAAPLLSVNDSVMDGSSYIYESDVFHDSNMLSPSFGVNNSAYLRPMSESDWSYENPSFHSLPSNQHRTKSIRTKELINSDVFTQSKVLIYRDHQKSIDLSTQSPEMDKANANLFESSDSLNSLDDPEVVAALDQIASEMGLINEPVKKSSIDPVDFLLTKRSLSEKFTNRRSDIVLNRRVNSQMGHYSALSPVMDDVRENGTERPSVASVNVKKQNSLKKLLNKLSRRSQSISPNKFSSFNHSSSSFKFVNPPADSYKIASVETESLELPSNEISTSFLINPNCKRLMNSLKIDRIENPRKMLQTITKNRSLSIGDNQISKVSDSCFQMTSSEVNSKVTKIPEVNSHFEIPQPSLSAIKYVGVSVSAFGYSPYGSSYKSCIKTDTKNIRMQHN